MDQLATSPMKFDFHTGDEAGKRPLLQEGDVGATLAATLEKRREFYEQCDVRVSIQGEENASDTAARVVADALAFIRAQRPCARPNDSFLAQLREQPWLR